MRYEIYTMRRTSSRTVYAIYDTKTSKPLCDRSGRPFTFTDRSEAHKWALAHERAIKTVPDAGS